MSRAPRPSPTTAPSSKLRENDLLGLRHIRYGGYGGIAYHHIADTDVALFTSFIPCGVWEAVHILDALLKNNAALQPDTLPADTQGQSESVFGLCRMLGIKLMPRMRGLSDTVFYRADKAVRYRHIDAMFGAEVDWDLIATYARDLVQVVLSIQAGWVMPSMLLRRLGSVSRRGAAISGIPRIGPGRAHPVPAALHLQRHRAPDHPRRDGQDRGLQRLPGPGYVRRTRGEERRPRRAGETARIRELGRQRGHAVQRRRPYPGPVRHGPRRPCRYGDARDAGQGGGKATFQGSKVGHDIRLDQPIQFAGEFGLARPLVCQDQ